MSDRLQREEQIRKGSIILVALVLGLSLGGWWSGFRTKDCSELGFQQATADHGSQVADPGEDCTIDFGSYLDIIDDKASTQEAVARLETRVADLEKAKERAEDVGFVRGYNEAGRDACAQIYNSLAAVFSLEDGHQLSHKDCLRDFAFRLKHPE